MTQRSKEHHSSMGPLEEDDDIVNQNSSMDGRDEEDLLILSKDG